MEVGGSGGFLGEERTESSFYTFGCLLDASTGKEERMALFLYNWPVR